MSLDLSSHKLLLVHQVREVAELVGFETRNKYRIVDEQKNLIAYAAEQGRGFFGFLFRQWLGHWRRFDIHFVTPDRQTFMVAHHPFRFFFQRVEVNEPQGRRLGAIQQRFAIFSKKFDVENERGQVILSVSSPLLKFWTFAFLRREREVAVVQKSGRDFSMSLSPTKMSSPSPFKIRH